MIKLILVDDHALFRLGLKTAIAHQHSDIVIVGEADSGAALFDLLENTAVDIVLLDILLPDMNGIDIARRMKTERPEIKILAISAENSKEAVQAMVEIGIEGFISKLHSNADTLVEAVRSIMLGLDFFGDDISKIIHRIYISKKKTAEVSSEFSQQEKRIIELCCDGLQAKEIAKLLEISPRTVEGHKEKIFAKLDIHSTLEMVKYVLKQGIIQI